MSRSAHITSIEDLLPLKSALIRFVAQTTDSLETIQLQNNRVVDWLERDRPSYWKERVRRGWDEVGAARSELERAKLRTVGDREPLCREEKAALDAAKRRLRFAEEKMTIVGKWLVKVRHEVVEYDARRAQLSRMLDSDLPQSIAVLERMIKALHSYAEIGKSAISVGSEATVKSDGGSDEDDGEETQAGEAG